MIRSSDIEGDAHGEETDRIADLMPGTDEYDEMVISISGKEEELEETFKQLSRRAGGFKSAMENFYDEVQIALYNIDNDLAPQMEHVEKAEKFYSAAEHLYDRVMSMDSVNSEYTEEEQEEFETYLEEVKEGLESVRSLATETIEPKEAESALEPTAP